MAYKRSFRIYPYVSHYWTPYCVGAVKLGCEFYVFDAFIETSFSQATASSECHHEQLWSVGTTAQYHRLAPSCQSVLRTTTKVNEKLENLTLTVPKTDQPIATKFGLGDHVGDIYPCAKFHYEPTKGICSPSPPRPSRAGAYNVTRLVFLPECDYVTFGYKL